jgi:hypothetical protein
VYTTEEMANTVDHILKQEQMNEEGKKTTTRNHLKE